jgi:hypothetical protein
MLETISQPLIHLGKQPLLREGGDADEHPVLRI